MNITLQYRNRLRKRREKDAAETARIIDEARQELKRQMALTVPPRGRPKKTVAAARIRLSELEEANENDTSQ